MQQHISPEWLNELSKYERTALRNMWKPQKGNLFICIGNEFLQGKIFSYDGEGNLYSGSHPLLNIGQMIEILIEHGESDEYDLYPTLGFSGNYMYPKVGFYWEGREKGKALIRALWDTVKEIIKEKSKTFQR